MKIDELTIKEAKELASLFGNQPTNKPHPFKIGKAYFIRTVTMILVGKLEAVYDSELVLSEASWIADAGRIHDTLKKGESNLNEVEPFIDEVVIGRHSIIDATIWEHSTNLKQK